MKSLDELLAERKEIDAQIEKAKEQEIQARREAVSKKLESFTEEQKEFLLSFVKHSSTYCSDTKVVNGLHYGYGYSDRDATYDCKKCMLIEVLRGDHGSSYDFSIDVNFWRVDDI